MGDVAILLLAAGASRRMRGRDKLLERIDGEPLLRRQAAAALATGAPVFVTLPPDAPERRAALEALDVTRIPVPDAAEGMAASLRAGVAAMPANAKAMMVVLADMPELTTADFGRVINAFEISPDAPILRGAAADGTPGHPVLFPRRLFPALSRVTGDRGARETLAENRSVLRPVPLPDRHALTDLDTPEAWAEWREKTGDKA